MFFSLFHSWGLSSWLVSDIIKERKDPLSSKISQIQTPTAKNLYFIAFVDSKLQPFARFVVLPRTLNQNLNTFTELKLFLLLQNLELAHRLADGWSWRFCSPLPIPDRPSPTNFPAFPEFWLYVFSRAQCPSIPLHMSSNHDNLETPPQCSPFFAIT